MEVALEIDFAAEVVTAVVFTLTMVELAIIKGVAVMIIVLCVGVTALLRLPQTEYIDVAFDLDA